MARASKRYPGMGTGSPFSLTGKRKAKVIRISVARLLDCPCSRIQGQDLNYANVSWYSDCRVCYGTGMTAMQDSAIIWTMEALSPWIVKKTDSF